MTGTDPTSPLDALRAAGASVWLDDLSRRRIRSGDLARLVADLGVTGITTNPTIFATALADGDEYATQLARLAASGASPEDAALELVAEDVAAAADLLRPLHDASAGRDGWVSVEVGADAAHDADRTLAEARWWHARLARPNVFVKIPATESGLAAIAAATAEGISVNVTLIFALDRYRAVVDAYLDGLERAHDAGRDLRAIRSVASFFVSRVDGAVDARLDVLGTERARALRGRTAVANARLAYAAFRDSVGAERMRRLAALGAHPQRPLWASTGVKDPALRDTFYVEELAAPDVVLTLPERTLRAVADHGAIRGDAITPALADADRVLAELAAVGVPLDEVTRGLEEDGVAQFAAAGRRLLATVAEGLRSPDLRPA